MLCSVMWNLLQQTEPPEPNISKEIREALKSLKEDESIMVLPEDIGRANVVMDADTYRTKMSTLIEAAPYQRLNKDPTDRFPVNVAKFTSVRREDLCKTGSKSTTGTSDSPVPRPPLLQNTPTTPDTTDTTTEVKFIDCDPHWYKGRVKEAIHIRLHPNNINRDNGIEFLRHGCPRSKNTTTGELCDSGPLREQQDTETARIEMRQSQLLKTNQSQRRSVLYKLTHNQSTLSPNKD
ncbi:hypothetical protein ACROYT_G027442 [Oculina patagonica]